MATTQNTFTGNGSNLGPFSFTFKWLESTDIKVSVGGVLKTAGTHYNLQSLNYTTKTGGQVLFTAGNAPANGASIRIFRDTDDEALSAVFSSGSAIRAKDLNDNFTQNLYVTQEVNNNALNVDGSNPMVGNLNMNGYQIDNLGEPTSDSDAATKKYIDDRYGNLSIPGFTRWSKTAVGGETTLSGVGTTGGTLGYSPNREQVYLNGAQLQRDADYTANNGTSIVLNVALIAGDVLEVICVNNLNTGTTAQAQDVYWNQSGSGAVTRTVESKLRDVVSVKDFGASPSASASVNKAAFEAALATGKPIYIPAGVYSYSGWNGLSGNNITIIGEGSSNTVLTYTGSGTALQLGTASSFSQGINISGITIQGNSNVTTIVKATALARCQWYDVNVKEANTSTGIGFVFEGCMLNRFDCLTCSQDRQSMVNPPAEGFNINALAPYGNSSNNTFTNLYSEGAGITEPTIDIGVRITGGDQNTFVGGSPESCKTYGLLVGANCRYNTFIGVGFENLDSTADVSDAGISSQYINCYSSENLILQGRAANVSGGFFERIQIDSGALRNKIQNVTINHWNTGSGGIYDSGTGTNVTNTYDSDLTSFVDDIQPQFLLSRTTSTGAVTGNGATYSATWDISKDNNQNCSSTGFTAPVTGLYQFNVNVGLDNLSTSANFADLRLVTTSKTYLTQTSLNIPSGQTQSALGFSVVAPMAAGDTAGVTVSVSGMAGNTATVLGSSSFGWTTFSGFKLN